LRKSHHEIIEVVDKFLRESNIPKCEEHIEDLIRAQFLIMEDFFRRVVLETDFLEDEMNKFERKGREFFLSNEAIRKKLDEIERSVKSFSDRISRNKEFIRECEKRKEESNDISEKEELEKKKKLYMDENKNCEVETRKCNEIRDKMEKDLEDREKKMKSEWNKLTEEAKGNPKMKIRLDRAKMKLSNIGKEMMVKDAVEMENFSQNLLLYTQYGVDEKVISIPPMRIVEEIKKVWSSVDKDNTDTKSKELQSILRPNYYDYLVKFMIIPKLIEGNNFHSVYAEILKSLDTSLRKKVSGEIFGIIKLLIASFSNDSAHILECLGNFMGEFFISRNQCLPRVGLDIKDVLLYGFQNNKLSVVIPFVCKIFLHHSKIYTPKQAWIASILQLLYLLCRIPLNCELDLILKEFFVKYKYDSDPADAQQCIDSIFSKYPLLYSPELGNDMKKEDLKSLIDNKKVGVIPLPLPQPFCLITYEDISRIYKKDFKNSK
jgi:hypothetical protein